METNNGLYVDQAGAGQYMIHQFKIFVGEDRSCEITSTVKCSLSPDSSPVCLQIYNHSTNDWETLDTYIEDLVDTNFTLTAEILRLSSYKDASNVITTRIYQLTL